MKNAFIELKNGYNTALPCEFMTEENGFLRLYDDKGQVGIFLLSQVEMCVITERRVEEK
jgi:hypothetical protein